MKAERATRSLVELAAEREQNVKLKYFIVVHIMIYAKNHDVNSCVCLHTFTICIVRYSQNLINYIGIIAAIILVKIELYMGNVCGRRFCEPTIDWLFE